MAQDQVDVMRELGFEKFFVAGHDRGARTAFRMALDHPERGAEGARFLDILPTHHVWTEVSMAWAINRYHWMFMAQPYDFPERLLRGNEEYYIRHKLTKQGLGKGGFTEEEIREYVRVCTPENIHGVCEDYRAAATIDFEMDTADFDAGSKVACPVLVIVGASSSHTGKHYGYEKGWSTYVTNLVGCVALPVRPLSGRAGARGDLRAISTEFSRAEHRNVGTILGQARRTRGRGESFMTADPKHAGELQGVIAQLGLVEYQPGSVVSRTLVKKCRRHCDSVRIRRGRSAQRAYRAV